MSNQDQPTDYNLFNYEPWNWNKADNLSAKERALNTNYITYPTAQSYPITFLNNVNVLSTPVGNYIANTAYLVSYWASILVSFFASTVPWSASQTMNNVVTDTLSGGTLVNPISPTYSYPIPSVGGNYPIGSYIENTTVITNIAGAGGTGASLISLTIPVGTWIIVGQSTQNNTNNFGTSAFISNVLNGFSSLPSGYNGLRNSSINLGITVYTVLEFTTQTTMYLNVRQAFNGGQCKDTSIRAVRIA
jgi:hypothetical protein